METLMRLYPLMGMLASPDRARPNAVQLPYSDRNLCQQPLQKGLKEYPLPTITWQEIPSIRPGSNPIYTLHHSFDPFRNPIEL